MSSEFISHQFSLPRPVRSANVIHILALLLHYGLTYFWFLTVLPCGLSPLKTPNPHVFSYFYHLPQLAVHLRPIHLTMPKVTDALRNDHTVEWTKDNITSRNSGRNTTSTLRHGYPGRHSTINLSQVKKTQPTAVGKRNLTQLQAKKSIFSVLSCS